MSATHWFARRFVQLFRRVALPGIVLMTVARTSLAVEPLPLVVDVEQQPLVSATGRLIEALSYVGAPLAEKDEKALTEAMQNPDAGESIRAIQKVLDPYCLVGVTINPESRVSVVEGPVRKELSQQAWRTYLVKVHNEAGVTAELQPESPNSAPLFMQGKGS
ncbi:MAG: hypothetical protein AB7O26_15700, partial [Planctomycetaceae bacterium]